MRPHGRRGQPADSQLNPPRGRGSGHGDTDVLRLQELVDADRSALAVTDHRHSFVVDEMSAATTPADVGELDIRFHELLVQLARSPRLTRMHPTFITETRMCIHALEGTYARAEVRADEHRAIANAIRSGDRELTDSLLCAHMDDAVNRLIPN